jgi:hypothetical protein
MKIWYQEAKHAGKKKARTIIHLVYEQNKLFPLLAVKKLEPIMAKHYGSYSWVRASGESVQSKREEGCNGGYKSNKEVYMHDRRDRRVQRISKIYKENVGKGTFKEKRYGFELWKFIQKIRK